MRLMTSDNCGDSTYGRNICLDALNGVQTHQSDPSFGAVQMALYFRDCRIIYLH